ncbi:MAG: CHRD domain-containing protein [Opitutaceae bacterium]
MSYRTDRLFKTPVLRSTATTKFCFSVFLPTLLFVAFSHGLTIQFQAFLTPDAVVPANASDDPSASTASGRAFFELNTDGVNGPELSYTIDLQGLTFDTELPRATSTGPDTQVRAVHFHFGAVGTNDIHALNVYGVPREDDDELDVLLTNLSGNWDDLDQNFGVDGVREAGDSVALSDALTALQNEELYIQVHTFAFRQGELRGQIVAVPEPATARFVFLIFGGFIYLCFVKRRRVR